MLLKRMAKITWTTNRQTWTKCTWMKCVAKTNTRAVIKRLQQLTTRKHVACRKSQKEPPTRKRERIVIRNRCSSKSATTRWTLIAKHERFVCGQNHVARTKARMSIKQQHADINTCYLNVAKLASMSKPPHAMKCVFDKEGVTETKEVMLAQRNFNCELIVTSN